MNYFQVDESSGIPIWLQVKNGLLHMIMCGSFKPGEQLPTVRQLAVILSINYNTVNKVYMELEREGFIVSRRGRGTFVTEVNHLDKQAADLLLEQLADEFIHKAFKAGITPDEILGMVRKRLSRSGEWKKEE